MAVNDNDMELLHEYLDGELPVSECEGLWRRLAIERELMGELDRLRADHAVRTMAWNSLEPDDSTMVRLEAKIMRATRREDIMSWAGNGLRIVASAAALVLFGFSVGWLGHDRMNGVPVVSHSSQTESRMASSDLGTSPVAKKFNVEFHDRNGNIVGAVQQFDSEAEANQYIQAVQQAQSGQNNGDLNVVPAINKF